MRNFAMNIISAGLFRGRLPVIARTLAVALAGILVLALVACEQPFRAGLGQIVDTQRPGVALVTPGGGSFIRSRAMFAGEGWDDLSVETVQFMITQHPGWAIDYLSEAEKAERLAWRDVEHLGSPSRSGGRITRNWTHTINTYEFLDGELRIRLRVSDGVNRDGSQWEETDHIVFFIRNVPPAIIMGLPVMEDVTEGYYVGRLGGRHLNFNFTEDGLIRLLRRVDGNAGMITGMIRDERGVNLLTNEEAGRFPPGFRMWEVVDPRDIGRHEELPGIPRVPSNLGDLERVMQAPQYGGLPWREFGQDGGMLVPISETSMQFFYSFPLEAQGRYFAFQVRAQGEPIDGLSRSFLFPSDEWSSFDGLDPEEQVENSFVAFLIVAPQSPPTLDLLAFQDIFGQDAWNPDPNVWEYRDIPGLNNDVPHELITDLAFNAKDGAFTLRVRARHEDGISDAVALWESGGRRGRFIWDPAYGNPRDGWNQGDNVPSVRPFSEWGRRDPNLSTPFIPSVRNFVFTYGGNVPHRVPDNAYFNHLVRGGYRIQEFGGTLEEWNSLYANIGDPVGWFVFRDSPLWQDDPWAENGTEGVFTIRIYARTEQGTANSVPLMTSLTIDREPPVLELTQLEGGSGEAFRHTLPNGATVVVPGGRAAHIVNGVIRPRIFASDARASDSGHRVSGGYFERPGRPGIGAEEIMFLLVRDSYRAAMEGLPRGFWPLPRAAGPGSVPVFPGNVNVTVSRHGPVIDGIAYIQTSRSHQDNRYEPLPDGLYWLYVFAQDRAFNVGRESFPIIVDAESDVPLFDFSIGLINRDETPVTDPNLSADGTPAGFYYGGTVRNMLRPTTDIRFRVRDDDSLNLGIAGDSSAAGRTRMTISFEGSFQDDGVIRPLSERDPRYLIEFGDADVKRVFRPRETVGSPALREREGTILQSPSLAEPAMPSLLGLLRANPMYQRLHDPNPQGGQRDEARGLAHLNTLNTLPDGMYRIVITIWDDPDFKLTMPGATYDRAEASYNTVEFWVAVDSVPPQVDLVGFFPVNEEYIPYYGRINMGSPMVTPRPPVLWDDNGPIRITGFRVRASEIIWTQGQLPGRTEIDVPVSQDWLICTGNPDIWEYILDIPVNIAELFPTLESGVFDFYLALADRFGNRTDIVRRHLLDRTQPTVTLTRPVETFTRTSVAGTYERGFLRLDGEGDSAVRVYGPIDVSRDNAGRLANDVISFTAHAHDNFIVNGIRWWLLPVGVGAYTIDEGTDYTGRGLNATGRVADFHSFPAMSEDPQRAIFGRGAFGQISPPGGEVLIDTSLLPDGEYHLHIIAMDDQNNQSHFGHWVTRIGQPIFLLQEEDKPYFPADGIRPAGGDVRGEHGLFVTGIVMDDDGFGVTVNPEPSSIRIWVSRSPLPGGLAPFPVGPENTVRLNSAPGWRGVDVPVTGSHLTLSGRDVILNIDLLELFGRDILYVGGERFDGTIYYVIRAQDAWQSKLGGTDRAARYRAFSFTLDSMPPDIVLTHPDPEGDVHDRIFYEDFPLIGYISDVHLSTMVHQGVSYVPYIWWTLNGESPLARFPLPTYIPPRAPGELVNQVAEINVMMSDLLRGSYNPPAWVSRFASILDDDRYDGEYALDLTVIDRLGLASVITLNFTIDRRPPEVSADFPVGTPAMSQADFDRWHRVPTDHDDRRTWAAARTLPVILLHDETVPTLTGGILDAFSDIPLRPGSSPSVPDIDFRLNNTPVPPNAVVWMGEGRNWRWEIPLAPIAGGRLPDGAHTLSIDRVRDRAGNPNPIGFTEHFAFRLDSQRPDLALDTQPVHTRVLGPPDRFGETVLTIGGVARDPNLRNIRLGIVGPGGRVFYVAATGPAPDGWGQITANWVWETERPIGLDPEVPWHGPTWALNWTFGLSRTGYARLASGQTYTIEAVANDWRPGSSESDRETWTFTKDVARPEIFFSGNEAHSNAPPTGPTNPVFELGMDALRFSGETQVIHGTVRDTHSDIVSVQSRIQRRNWHVLDDRAGDAWEPMFTAPGDIAGWREIQVPPDQGVPGNNGGILTGGLRDRIWRTPGLGEGGLYLTDGLYRIQIRAMDSSWFPGSTDDFGPNSMGNPVESDWQYFFFDRAAPSLPEPLWPTRNVLGPPDRFPNPDSVFYIGVNTVRDSNLRGVRLRISRIAHPDDPYIYAMQPRQVFIVRDLNHNLAGETGIVAGDWTWDNGVWNLAWTFDLTRDMYSGLTPGGTFEVEIVALDWREYGESERRTWTFTKDTERPVIEFSNANEYTVSSIHTNVVFVGDSQSIIGTVADVHSDIVSVQGRIERFVWDAVGGVGIWEPLAATNDWGNWHEFGPTGGGTLTGGPRNRIWRTPVLGEDGLDLDDGLFRIQIRARDSSYFTGGTTDFGPNSMGNPTYADSNWLYFFFDRAAPTLESMAWPPHNVLGASSEFPPGDPVFTIGGTARDYNLRGVRVRIREIDDGRTVHEAIMVRDLGHLRDDEPTGNAIMVAAGWGRVGAKWYLNWTYGLSRDVYGTFAPGQVFEVEVVAMDWRDRGESIRETWRFTKDTTSPIVRFLNDATDSPPPQRTGDFATAELRFTDVQTIHGTVTDAHSDIYRMESRIQRRNQDVPYDPDPNSATWYDVFTRTGMTGMPADRDGWREIRLDGGFDGGTRIGSPGSQTWRTPLLGIGGLNLSDGLYRIQVRAWDSSWVGEMYDGYPVIHGNPSDYDELGWLYFFFDRNVPTRTLGDHPAHNVIGSMVPNRFDPGALEVVGTASDANLRAVRLTHRRPGSADPDVVFFVREPAHLRERTPIAGVDRVGDTGWRWVTDPVPTWVMDWSFDFGTVDTLQEGDHVIEVVALDWRLGTPGVSAPVTWSFTKDTSAPVIGFSDTLPTGAGNVLVFSGDTQAIYGTVTDAFSNIYRVESRIERRNQGVPEDAPGAWSPWFTALGDTDGWREMGPGGNGGTLAGDLRNRTWRTPQLGVSVADGGLGLPDGLFRIRVRAMDSSWVGAMDGGDPIIYGNQTYSDWRIFHFDRSPPTLTTLTWPDRDVFGPPARFETNAPVLTVRGTARDENLRGVRLRIRGVGNTEPSREVIMVRDRDRDLRVGELLANAIDVDAGYWRWEEPAWYLDWTFDLTRADYEALGGSGTFDIEVVALDWRDGPLGESERRTWRFTRDDYSPEIFFFDDASLPVRPDRNPGIDIADVEALFYGDSQTIHGTVRDSHSDIISVQSRIQRRNQSVDGTADDAWINVFAEPGGWRQIREDGGGNGGTLTGSPRNRNWRTPRLGVSVADGGLGLTDGLYRIQIRAMDSSWFPGGTDDFGHDNTMGNPTDAESNWLYFFFDRAAPELTLDTTLIEHNILGPVYGITEDLTVRGTARDPNLRGVEITFSSNNVTHHTVSIVRHGGHRWGTPTMADLVGYDNWHWDGNTWELDWEFNLGEVISHLYSIDGTPIQGNFEVSVVALDWRYVGAYPSVYPRRSAPETWRFTRDILPPDIFFGTDTMPSNAPITGPTNENLLPWDLNNPLPANIRVVRGNTEMIQGRVSDQHSDIRHMQSRIQRINWNGDAQVSETGNRWWDNFGDAPGGWRDIPPHVVGPGGTRSPDPVLNYTWSWNTPHLGVSVADGGLGLPDGLFRIQIRAMDSSWFPESTYDFGPNSMGNPRHSEWLYFYVDRAPLGITLEDHPAHDVIGYLSLVPNQFAPDALEIGGRASGANLRGVRLTHSRLGADDTRVVYFVREPEHLRERTPIAGVDRVGGTGWTWANDRWTFDWSFDLGTAGALAQGDHRIEVVALNWIGDDYGSDPETWTFTKDTSSPDIGFAAFPEGNVFVGETQTIHGTVTDDFSDIYRVESRIERRVWEEYNDTWVYRWIGVFDEFDNSGGLIGEEVWREMGGANNEGGTLTGTLRNRTWRTPALGLGGLDLPDGLYRIRIRAMDSSWVGEMYGGDPVIYGNLTYSDWRIFHFDRRPPTLATPTWPTRDVFGPPAGFGTAADTVLTVSGTARDENLRGVRLRISEIGNLVPSHEVIMVRDRDNDLRGDELLDNAINVVAGWDWVRINPNDPTYGYTWELDWTFDLTRAVYEALGDPGTFEIEVVALDWRAGTHGMSVPATWRFTKDTISPNIHFFTDPVDSNAPPTGPTNDNFVMGTTTATPFSSPTSTIHGSVFDAHSDVSSVEFRVQKWDWDNPANRWQPVGSDPWRSITELVGSPRNRIWRTPQLGVSVADGGLGLTDGLYRIQIRARDSSWVVEGQYSGNPVYSNWLYFRFDITPPALDFDPLPPQAMSSRFGTVGVSGSGTDADPYVTHYVASGSLGFRVRASDGNRLASVEVRIYDTAVPPVPVANRMWTPGHATNPLGTGDYVHEVHEIFEIPGITGDGMRTVVVTAVDLAGNSSTIRRGFGLDNTSPGGSFASPDVGEILGSDPLVTISGEPSDSGAAASGAYRMWFRFGMLGDAFPSADSLASRYALDLPLGTVTAGAAANDTAHNNQRFGADSWFEMNYAAVAQGGTPGPFQAAIQTALPGSTVRVTRGMVHSWEIQATAVDLLAFASQTYWRGVAQLSYETEDGFLDMPVWFRVVDAAGNAGYFGRVIRINQEADRPVNRIETPSDRIGSRDSPRGGAVSFDGSAEIGLPSVHVGHVLYRVWVGHPLPAGTPSAAPEGQINWEGTEPGTWYRMRVVTQADLLGMPTAELSPAVQALLTYHDLWEVGQNHWFPAILDQPGTNMSPWNFRLNTDREITDLMNTVGTRPGMGFVSSTGLPAPPDAENDMLFVMVETVAINNQSVPKMSIGGLGDGGTLYEPVPNRRMFYLRDTAPTISAFVRSEGSEGTGATNPHRGRFTITAYLDAMAGMSITEVRIVRPDEGFGLNETVSFAAGGSGVNGLVFTWDEEPRTARIVYTLDSTLIGTGSPDVGSVRGGAWARGGGTYRVEIRVSDSTTPDPSITTITLPIVIDNFAPVADTSMLTPPSRAGLWESFQGRALDGSLVAAIDGGTTIGTAHAGARIDRVYAWFESGIGTGAEFISHSIRGAAGRRARDAAGTSTFDNAWEGRNAQIGGPATAPTVTFENQAAEGSNQVDGTPRSVRIPTVIPLFDESAADGEPGSNAWPGDPWIMRISGASAGHHLGTARGHLWMDSVGGRVVHWMFNVNTTVLPDGPLTLRYIVVDAAGNASLYQQSVIIRNHIPQIREVTLRTEDAGGNVVDGLTLASLGLAPRPEGYIDTGWTVRNRALGLTVDTIQGNAPLNFRLQHVTRERMELDEAGLTTLRTRRTEQGANFIYLFTVSEPGPAVLALWNNLGYTGTSSPSEGAHFVASGLVDAAAMPGTFVWVYTQGAAPVSHGPVGWRTPDLTDSRVGVGTPTLTFPRTGGVGDTGAFVDVPTGIGRITHGRNLFLLRAWDSVTAATPPTAGGDVAGWVASPEGIDMIENNQLHVAAVLAMDVFLFDTEAPGAVLHDLNPFFERGVTGNNLTPAGRNATIRNALAPDPYDQGVGGNFNRDRGGLFNAGTVANPARSGHIEPRAGSPLFNEPRPTTWGNDSATAAGQGSLDRDLVSGRIILRGRATDNERVERIELAITQDVAALTTAPATGAWFTILEWDAGRMTPRAGSPTTNPTMRPVAGPVTGMGSGNHVFDARAEESLDWQGGHEVEWSFMWDTETFLSAGPAGNVRISVRVTDAGGLSNTTHSHVNIVPYITGFERQARYQTIRSMQGWYSFYQGEIGIAALGFNLGGGAIATTGGIGLTGATSAANTNPLGGRHRINFAIPTDAQSGRINFTIVPATSTPTGAAGIAPVPIRNHVSNHEQFWNRENLFGVRSNLWINRPYAHIWRSHHTDAAPATFMGPLANSVRLDHPGMALQHTVTSGVGANNRNRVGMLHGAWSIFGDGMVHYGTNQGGRVVDTGTGAAPGIEATRIASAVPSDPFLQPDISLHAGTGIPAMAFVAQDDGAATVRMRSTVHAQAGVAGIPPNPAGFPILVASAAAPTQRWQNVRTARAGAHVAEGNAGRLFTTVYDSFRRELVFITQGSVRAAGETGTANATTVMSIDGTAPTGVTVGGQTQITASGTRATNAGQFSAVGFDAVGPIIAYTADDTIRVAFGTNFATVAGTASNWSRVEILAGHALRNGSGGYVSMAIDAGGGIHLAFFNSVHGALVYAHSTGRDQPFTAHVVDTAPGVGTWTDISIDGHGNPWIVYGYRSRQGQFDGVRVAYRSANASNVGSGTRFSRPVNCRVSGVRVPGYWEALQMAAPFSVIYDRLNIEAWPPNANSGATMASEFTTNLPGGRPWSAAIGFRGAGSGCALGGNDTNERFRIGYFFWPDPAAATIGTTWPPAP